MTITESRLDAPTQRVTAASLDERITSTFDPVIERIAAGAALRERERRLPHDEVAQLRAAGFGALRVPVSHGGWGVSLEQLFRLLIRLGAADSNLPQLLRGHVAFVETQLGLPESAQRDRWLTDIGRGDVLVGNAQAERSDSSTTSTVLEEVDGRLTITGRKFYSTGTLFADWIWSGGQLGDEAVAVAVRADAPGVTRIDDWDGFGQRLTGSGTTIFEQVEVDPAHVLPWTVNDEKRSHAYIQGLYQLVLLASLAGISRAVLRDTVDFVRPRSRTFGIPGTSSPRDDELVQRVVGRLSSIRFTVEATVLEAVRQVAAADDRRGLLEPGDTDPTSADERRYYEALVAVFEAQQTVIPLVLESTSLLFEVGGASAVSVERGLDRHWRNARTISSHNPAIHRERMLGDFRLNGTIPRSALIAQREKPADT